MNRFLITVFTTFLLILLASGAQTAEKNTLVLTAGGFDTTVEVSPDKFITFSRYQKLWELKHKSFRAVHSMETEKAKFFQKDITFLSIPADNEKKLFWVGVGIPVSLRSHNNNLYMITFDRDTDFNKIRFRFYMEDHTTLREIRPKEYPKSLAIQNLWLRKENGFRNGKPINQYDVVRRLDPDDLDFPSSLTAKIWYQLEKVVEYYEASNERIDKDFLKKYKTTHKVIKLNKIIKDK